MAAKHFLSCAGAYEVATDALTYMPNELITTHIQLSVFL